MENNKKINEEELTNVAGGEVPVQKVTHYCPNCGHTVAYTPCRTVGEGCDEHLEYQCTNCGTWSTIDW